MHFRSKPNGANFLYHYKQGQYRLLKQNIAPFCIGYVIIDAVGLSVSVIAPPCYPIIIVPCRAYTNPDLSTFLDFLD